MAYSTHYPYMGNIDQVKIFLVVSEAIENEPKTGRLSNINKYDVYRKLSNYSQSSNVAGKIFAFVLTTLESSILIILDE